MLLRRAYRRAVAAPRHRLTITRRAKTLDLHRRRHAPAHLRVDEAEPRVTARLAD
jgi:hypothetical protein